MKLHNFEESIIIEELYLALQFIILLVLLMIAFPLLSENENTQLKVFCGFYLFYILYKMYLFFKDYAQNNKDNEHDLNIFLSILDGIFVAVFIYIYRGTRIDFYNLIFVYVLIQSIRYPLPYNMIFAGVASIISCAIILYTPNEQINYINLMSNIVFIFSINVIVGFALSQIYQLQRERKFYYEQLSEKNNELHQLATTDYLTGLKNHQSFYEYFNVLKNKSCTFNKSFCMALLDIDNFKSINDTYGHIAGDQILRELASVININVRKKDFVARYGGEEFAVLFSDTDISNGIVLCERVREAIASTSFTIDEKILTITVSIGVSCLAPNNIDNNYYSFIKTVDGLLYDAKTSGKNKVIY